MLITQRGKEGMITEPHEYKMTTLLRPSGCIKKGYI